MADKRNPLDIKNKGFFQDLVMQIKLILRLMGDRDVNFLLKLLPVGALIYVILPVDLIPEIAIPLVGYLDDAAVLWLSLTLFVALCPDEVVKKHREALENVIHGTWRDAQEKESAEIVKAEEEPKDGPAG